MNKKLHLSLFFAASTKPTILNISFVSELFFLEQRTCLEKVRGLDLEGKKAVTDISSSKCFHNEIMMVFRKK